LALKWHLITDTAYGTIFENKRPDCRKAILTQQYRAAKKRWDDRPLAGYPLIVLVFVYISPIGIGAMPRIARHGIPKKTPFKFFSLPPFELTPWI
jgi:hypothetical protein